MLYGAEVCALGAGEQAGDIFEYGELGIFSMSGTPRLLNYANGFKEQTASFALVKPRLGSPDSVSGSSTNAEASRPAESTAVTGSGVPSAVRKTVSSNDNPGAEAVSSA